MLKKEETIRNINTLKNFNGTRMQKMIRNYRMYTWSPTLSLNQINSGQVTGYYSMGTYDGEENTSSISLNIVQSIIDTLVSKIASQKVRPFFNTINGSFKDIKLAKQTQNFFDIYFDEQNVNKIISLAFKDACISSDGIIYIDNTDNYRIKRVNPWQVYLSPAEVNYDNIVQVAYERKQYPVSLIKDVYDIKTKLEYITRIDYYNTLSHQHTIYIPELNKCINHEYKANKIPFIFLHYIDSVVSNSPISITDILYGIQMEIDGLMKKIKDAAALNPALTFFIPEGSQIKAKELDNRVGNIITYKPTPNMTTSPITTSTQAFIDPEYMQLLQQLMEKGYELVGISQLSAMSQKPKGLDSGVALESMENIESDRFETQLNQVIRAYTDLTKLYIEIIPEDIGILPTDRVREELTWKDIKKSTKQMNIQYSGANALSKDPETKLKQLMLLQQNGIVPRSRIATLMEVPDLEAGYSISNNALNATLAVIDDCIVKDKYDIPFFIPIDMLKEEIANTMLSLQAADSEGNKEDIMKLKRLYEVVCQSMSFVNETMNMQQAVQDESVAVDNQAAINSEQDANINGLQNVVQANE